MFVLPVEKNRNLVHKQHPTHCAGDVAYYHRVASDFLTVEQRPPEPNNVFLTRPSMGNKNQQPTENDWMCF